ncbi:DUF3124 domain-containing protein [Lignipirellula cremea]|uniref:DUF3124 domain-containing protein n=1 Tax=Lignipirellula cremea TaxID=2528010 RepID=A0A518DNS7_9BACT|nr:DUF3124 domain-containing protein [Lignipirellula cremea]QDU93494.1 hypothetical protein Pla8534_12740 [Lignipirellula cremea]
MANKEIPAWVLWIGEHTLLSLLGCMIVLLGVPVAVVAYLDYRITQMESSAIAVRPLNEPSGATPADLPATIVRGQTVYVPLYSHVYEGDGQRLLLAGTLSIRNTDSAAPISISSVKYYDTEGKLVRDFLPETLQVRPLGSTDFFVKQQDTAGGSGANFLVEWVADRPVHQPIIEAVMVGRSGSGISTFVRPGEVLLEHMPSADPPAAEQAED